MRDFLILFQKPEMSFAHTERMRTRKSDVNGNYFIIPDFTTSLSRWMLVLNQLQDVDIPNHQFNQSDYFVLDIIAFFTGSTLNRTYTLCTGCSGVCEKERKQHQQRQE